MFSQVSGDDAAVFRRQRILRKSGKVLPASISYLNNSGKVRQEGALRKTEIEEQERGKNMNNMAKTEF